MSIIYYPAVFHISKDTLGYWIEFPDLPGCFSQGETMDESMEHAEEALGLCLDQDEESCAYQIASPSKIEDVMAQFPNEIVLLIKYDRIKYARMYKTKAIKKTLSIPSWLNEEAMRKGFNFSKVLQEALLNKLEITK